MTVKQLNDKSSMHKHDCMTCLHSVKFRFLFHLSLLHLRKVQIKNVIKMAVIAWYK